MGSELRSEPSQSRHKGVTQPVTNWCLPAGRPDRRCTGEWPKHYGDKNVGDTSPGQLRENFTENSEEPIQSLTVYLNTRDFAGLAFNKHVKWPATDLAIGREALGCDACVDHKLKALAAVWALDRFGNFHVAMINLCDFRRH